jgi:hypothetical protein
LPPEWERILNESGITAQEQESNAGTVIQVLNAAANIKTKGLGRMVRSLTQAIASEKQKKIFMTCCVRI